jgi:hypothetical protein
MLPVAEVVMEAAAGGLMVDPVVPEGWENPAMAAVAVMESLEGTWALLPTGIAPLMKRFAWGLAAAAVAAGMAAMIKEG